MEALTLVLFLSISVLVSAVIDQIVPKVSLPLIQIVMGCVIAIFARDAIVISLEPDLFLVLFIAPLLYIEAKSADKLQLWINRTPILLLAIGLVVVTAVVIGFALNALVPAVSLAAAFALGAALGPTDAVAVSSLSKQVTIPTRQWNILRGELLLNDASGIVMFQFALSAALYGSFNVGQVATNFLVEFFGGLIFGAILGYGANFALRKIRDLGIESTTFHVLFELCVPFMVYLISQSFHVSGIIAVVVAGLLNVISPRSTSPNIARMNIVSSNVWDVLSFTLNGIVFVLLGTQLPAAMVYTWNDNSISNFALIGYILFITLLLMGTRFLWCLAMEWVHVRRTEKSHFRRSNLNDVLTVTFSGAKGTITLSILFTIPVFMSTGEVFPARNLLIFIGCGVILLTLLLATFGVPLVAPKRERKQSEIEARNNYFEVLADVLRNVIEALTEHQTRKNRAATRAVIRDYQTRLANTKDAANIPDELNVELRVKALRLEKEWTESLMASGVVSKDIGYEFIERIDRIIRLTMHRGEGFSPKRLLAQIRVAYIRARSAVLSALPDAAPLSDRVEELRRLQIETAKHVIDALTTEMAEGLVPVEDASNVLMEYERNLSVLSSERTSVTTSIRIVDQTDDIRRYAYQVELEQIQEMYEADRISRQEARNMRENVYLMQMDLEDKL